MCARPREKTLLVERTMMSVTSVPKYTRRLDFTTGKQVDRGDKLLRKCKAVALANKLERMRSVRGISQVTPLGWLQSRLKMRNESSSPTVYIVNY